MTEVGAGLRQDGSARALEKLVRGRPSDETASWEHLRAVPPGGAGRGTEGGGQRRTREISGRR